MNRLRFFQIFVFILLIVSIDQVIGRVTRHLYFSQKAGQNYSLNYVFTECRSQILIFGNSRAQHHYDTHLLSDSLKMSCYNAGQDGGHSIFLPYAQIQVILRRYAPEIIILEFDPNSVKFHSEDYDKLSVLLPYYSVYQYLHPLIEMRSPFEKEKLLSASYPFNSNIVNIIRYNTKSHAARKKDMNGYIPMDNRTLNMTYLRNYPVQTLGNSVDPNKLKALKDIIQLCKDHHVLLLIVNSPKFYFSGETPNSVSSPEKQAMDIIHQEKTIFLDFSNDAAFAKRMDLFADRIHLNLKGAMLFTQEVAAMVKSVKKTISKKEM